MIDSHAHLISEFYNNIEDVVEECKKNGIIKIVNCADSIKTTKEVIKYSNAYNGYLYATAGIHPQNVDNSNKEELENLIIENKIVAIGEIGLDYNYSKDNIEKQKELFNYQLNLAEKYKLPIIVHTRDSMQDTYDILKTRKLKGVIHCYSGSLEMAKLFINLGYKLGIGGVLTFKNSNLYKVIEKISLNDILLETDSPFLSPEPYRGKTNIPLNVWYIAKKISEIKKTDVDTVINETTRNSNQLFDI